MSNRIINRLFDMVLDALAERGAPPTWRLIPGRVVAYSNNLVDVLLQDPTNQLKYVSKVPLRAGVGQVSQIAPGSFVLVGWDATEETAPFALYNTWISGGSLVSLITTFTSLIKFDGPTVEVTKNLKVTHEVSGGPVPRVAPLGAGNVSILSGGDRMVTIKLEATGNVPAGTPLAKLTYGTSWGSVPNVLGIEATQGAPLAVIPTQNDATIKMGWITAPVPAGDLQLVIWSSG